MVNDLGNDSISGSDSDVPSAWPGTPTSYDFNNTPQLIQPVWIGVSEDGSTNQVYPIDTPVTTILGDGWVHVYQGTEIVGQDDDVQVFSEQYQQLLAQLDACCGTSFATAPFALKQSNQSLAIGDPNPPCGADAFFKWLALFGSTEDRDLAYRFTFSLIPADEDMLEVLTFRPANELPFTETVQLLKKWPDDFVGMVSLEGVTLVGPTAEPGVNERRVSDFDGGTIGVVVTLFENDEQIDESSGTWRLPGTICTSGCSIVNWQHIDNVFGLLEIKVNDEAIVYSTKSHNGFSFYVKAGDEVECIVSNGDAENRLTVSEQTAGQLFTQNSPPGPVTFSFTAACGKVYTVLGRTQGGE